MVQKLMKNVILFKINFEVIVTGGKLYAKLMHSVSFIWYIFSYFVKDFLKLNSKGCYDFHHFCTILNKMPSFGIWSQDSYVKYLAMPGRKFVLIKNTCHEKTTKNVSRNMFAQIAP